VWTAGGSIKRRRSHGNSSFVIVETTLNRKDYGLLWNKALEQGGFLLGDEVEVVINLETAKKTN